MIARRFVPLIAVAVVAGVIVALPLLHAADEKRRKMITATMPAVVLVMAVDVVDGQLKPVASGSGTIVDADGSVLTNYHVINDAKNSRLYDLFVIGRFRAADRDPEMVCAGRPVHGRLKQKLDLALIKCELDMNGQPWEPSRWPTLPLGRSEDILPGEQVWVLGYPNVGGSTIHVTAGGVSGWMAEQGGPATRAFMKTDAQITHGNSGGTAVDEDGNFIGVPTAFRQTTAQQGEAVVSVGNTGLIRPIEHARDLIAIAAKGWKPGTEENMVEVVPELPDKPETKTAGVVVTSKVIDAANKNPIAGAFVIVFKPGIKAAEVHGDQLEQQALSWGQTNAGGVFELNAAVPRQARYTVAVLADGYQPLAVDDALVIGKDAPDLFDPWTEIRLERQ